MRTLLTRVCAWRACSYCCRDSNNNSQACPRHDFCAGNRTGVLCGSCKRGFSESISNSDCTLDRYNYLECY